MKDQSTLTQTAPRSGSLSTLAASLGILAILAGALALAFPNVTAFAVTLAVGAFIIASGIVHIADGVRGPERSWIEALLGLLYLILGGMVVASPLGGALSMTVLLSFLLWAGGAFRLAAAITGEAEHRWLAAIGGLCSLALGFIFLWSSPAQAIWMLGLFAGLELLFSGISMIRISRHLPAPLRTPQIHHRP